MKKRIGNGSYLAMVLNKKQLLFTLSASLLGIFLFFFSAFRLGTAIKLPSASFKPILKSAVGITMSEDDSISDELLLGHIVKFFSGFDPRNPTSYMASIGNVFSYVVPENIEYKENFSERLILDQTGKYVPVEPKSSLPSLPDEIADPAKMQPVQEGELKIVDLTSLKGSSENYMEAGGIKIKNGTKTLLNANDYLNADLPMDLQTGGPKVLIVHTHSTESYAPSNVLGVPPSFTGRNTNPDENIIKVGDVICDILNQNGIETVHDSTLHDYPSYNGAYTRSLQTVKKNLEKYPTIEMVIDVHRDAITMNDGSPVKYTAEVDGKKAAQVMLVMGSNDSALDNPNWKENLKYAFQIQKRLNDLYPQLARPINISKNRYNQHATLGSMILEVGTHVNTMEEAIRGASCAAQAIVDVLKGNS